MVYVDEARCTGCGLCTDVCPTEAIALVDGRVRVDEELCTGCEACVNACPEGAIQPVVQGELIPAPKRTAPTVYQPSPLAETAGAAVVVAGTGLLMTGGEVYLVLGRLLPGRRERGEDRRYRRGFSAVGGTKGSSLPLFG